MIFNNLFSKNIIIPIILGTIFCLIIVGIYPLNPQHFSLARGLDPVQHYLGWAFFRFNPWTFPIGLNPSYGLEISSSIVFTDSIPLFAFIFKTFSERLPNSFQYFGLWALTCFVLQAYFGWIIIGLLSKDLVVRILATSFFLISPPMLSRIGIHAALASHFFILSAFYLILRVDQLKNREIYWGTLLGISCLVHFYIFVMVFVLWVGNLLDQTFRKQNLIKNSLVELVALSVIIVALLWQAGYFALNPNSGSIDVLYGFHKLDPLFIFNSKGWSYFLPSESITSANDEGFIYLGLGVIALIPTAFYSAVKKNTNFKIITRNNIFVFGVLIALILFAMTHRIKLPYLQYEYELPEWLLLKASILRMAPRMFWPVFYAIILSILYANIKGYSKWPLRLLLFIALILQLVDTSAGWLPKRIFINTVFESDDKRDIVYPPIITSPMQSLFWATAAKKYKSIRLEPLTSTAWQNHYALMGAYAAKYHLSTNSVYLARVDASKVVLSNDAFINSIWSKNIDTQSFYVLEKKLVVPVILNLNRDKDLLAHIDGFTIFAPNWKQCIGCPKISNEISLQSFLPRIKLDEMISFSKEDFASSFLFSGWDRPEKWGTWSIGKVSSAILPLPNNHAHYLRLRLNAPLYKGKLNQKILVSLNNSPAQSFTLKKNENEIYIQLTNIDRSKGWMLLKIQVPNPAKPIDYDGFNKDSRQLGIGLVSAVFH